MREARYDAYARWYSEWVLNPDYDFVARSLLDIVGVRRPGRILDLGCGDGRMARELAASGNEVVGIDLSKELLALAEVADCTGVTYVRGDACTVDWWDGRQFDGVISSMALMDIDDLEGALATVSATLRTGGWFAWSIVHPGFVGIGTTRSSWPTGGSYFDEGWWRTDGDGVRGRVGVNHRTLSTYLNSSIRAGLVLEAVAEPPWSSPVGRAMPFFLVCRWRRM